jgi:hypothetical protein
VGLVNRDDEACARELGELVLVAIFRDASQQLAAVHPFVLIAEHHEREAVGKQVGEQ